MPTRLPFEEFKAIYAKVPRLTVDLIITASPKPLFEKAGMKAKKGFKLPHDGSEAVESLNIRKPRLLKPRKLIKSDRGILLTLRNIPPKQGFWHFPGGTVLMDETVEAAIQRVAREELGIEVSVKKLLGLMEFYQTDSVDGHAVSIVFLVNLKSEDFKLNEQASEVKFFTRLPENIIKEHREFLEKYDLV